MVSGLRGSSYPDDLPGQTAMVRPMLEPIVRIVMGSDVPFELYTRRGAVRGHVLPPCEMDFKDPSVASRFRSEAARLSRAKHEGLAHLYFNTCITLATRCVSTKI